MSKVLIFCEKPSQSREYVQALKEEGAFKQENGRYESNKYIIVNGVGHIMRSKEMKDYEGFGGWSWEAVPFIPPKGKLEMIPNESTLSQLAIVKEQFKRTDIEYVVNATDPGREGDLIFWEVYDGVKSTLPVKRSMVATLLPEEIRKAMKNLKGEDFYLPRRDAAYARQYADWIMGMNLTVAFSIKAKNTTLHVGRVQTPTVAILANRRKEIEEFKPSKFYEIDAEFGGKYKGRWFKDSLSETRIEKEEDAKAIAAKIENKTGKVTSKSVEEERQKPKKLYNLTSLQIDASKKFGYDPTKVLEIAQVLYEKYKYTSYPRTSSNFLDESYVEELEPTLKAIQYGPYEKSVDEVLTKGIKTNKGFVDGTKLSDHHAIVPTITNHDLSKITDEMKGNKKLLSRDEIINVYDLIVKRFISVFYEPALYEVTKLVTEVEGETFKTSGKVLKDLGWKKVYGEKDDDDDDDDDDDSGKKKKGKKEKVKVVILPPIEDKEENNVTSTNLDGKETKPPKHYTIASLLAAMSNPARLLEEDDKEVKEAFGENVGLGTEATRAGIIDNIIRRKYIENKGKSIVATDLGMNLISIAPESLKSPVITAKWELKLADMEIGKEDYSDFKQEIETYVEEIITDLKDKEIDIVFGNPNEGKAVGICPICKGEVIEGKWNYQCETPECFKMGKNIASKEITETHLKQVLTKGATPIIKGFKSKNGKSFAARLVLKDKEITFDFSDELEIECPKCGEKLAGSDKIIKCPKDEKHLLIFKTISGKKLPTKELKNLVEKGKTGLITGFVSKKGTKYDAYVVLGEDGRTSLEFEKREKPKETNMKCPLCGGNVTENAKSFGCSNWREKQCGFTMWKTMSGRAMKLEEYKEIIESPEKKSKEKLKGFISKANKPYDAFVKYNEETKRFEFSFE